MTGKLEYIRNYDSLLILPCLATNAMSLLDGVASDIALERPSSNASPLTIRYNSFAKPQ